MLFLNFTFSIYFKSKIVYNRKVMEEKMKIVTLGTGAITAKMQSACTLINDKILIDVPNGICKSMKQQGYAPEKIEIVIITHFHGDHFLICHFSY